MIKSPQLAISDSIFIICKKYNENVFEYLPSYNQAYPFIHIGDVINSERKNNDLMGDVDLAIDIWGSKEQVALLDELMIKIRDDLSRMRSAFNFNTIPNNISIEKMTDNTTNELLIRNRINVSFTYTRKD